MLNSPLSDEETTEVEELEPDDTGETEQLDKEPADDGAEESEESPEEGLIATLDEEDESDDKQKPWVNDLRKRDREKTKRIRELERELEAKAAPGKSDDLGKEPELEDYDYDSDQFKTALKGWYAKKADVDARKAKEREAQEEIAKQFQQRQETYTTGKARFPKEKMQEAEDEVVATLSQSRQSMLLDVADDSAALVATLGLNPKTLQSLAKIKSDALFIKELTKVEMKIQSTTKKQAPPPERVISGSGKTPGSSTSNLDRLYEQAQKSGDYSKYHAEKERLKK